MIVDADEHVPGYGAPHLRLHCVLAVAQEMFDPQVLLDQLDEQFDLPVALLQAREVQIAAIHHLERTGLQGLHVQHVHVVQLAVADVDEGGNRTAQIQHTPVPQFAGIGPRAASGLDLRLGLGH